MRRVLIVATAAAAAVVAAGGAEAAGAEGGPMSLKPTFESIQRRLLPAEVRLMDKLGFEVGRESTVGELEPSEFGPEQFDEPVLSVDELRGAYAARSSHPAHAPSLEYHTGQGRTFYVRGGGSDARDRVREIFSPLHRRRLPDDLSHGLEGKTMMAGKKDKPTNVAFVEAAQPIQQGAALERTPKEDTRKAPAKQCGRIEMVTNKGKAVGSCSGTLVGTHTVLTAAHCITSRRLRKAMPPKALRFVPGQYEAGDAPYGVFKAKGTVYPKEYLELEHGGWLASWDFAVVCLEKDASKKVGGFLGTERVPEDTAAFLKKTAYMWSYPGRTKTGHDQYRDACKVQRIEDGFDVAQHFCDTEPGSSGAGVLFDGAGGRKTVVGVHHSRARGASNLWTQLDAEHDEFLKAARAICEGKTYKGGALAREGEEGNPDEEYMTRDLEPARRAIPLLDDILGKKKEKEEEEQKPAQGKK